MLSPNIIQEEQKNKLGIVPECNHNFTGVSWILHAAIRYSAEIDDEKIRCVSLTLWQSRIFCRGVRYLEAALYNKNKKIEKDNFALLRHARVSFKKLSLYSPLAQLLLAESTFYVAAEAALNNHKDKVSKIDREGIAIFNRFRFYSSGGSPYLSYSEGIANSLNNLATIYENEMSDLETAYHRKLQALYCFKLLPGSKIKMAQISVNLGVLLSKINGDREKAINFIRDGVNIMKDSGVADENYARALYFLGDCLEQDHIVIDGKIEIEAIPYLRESLKIRQKKNKVSLELIDSYTALGNALGSTVNQRKEGIELLRKANDLAQNLSNQKYLAMTFANLGSALMETDEIENSKIYIQKALDIYGEKKDFSRSKAISLLNLGIITEKFDKNYEKAIDLKKQALELINHTDDLKVAINLRSLGESLVLHSTEIKQGIEYIKKSINILSRAKNGNYNKLLAISSLLPFLDKTEAKNLAFENISLLNSYVQTAPIFLRTSISKSFDNALK